MDYGLFAAVTANVNAGMIAPLVPAFKLFMGSTTGNILLDDDEEMIPSVRDVLATGKRMSVHAEDDHLISRDVERCTRDHRINICHLTTPEGLDMAKAAGFTTEVTMHHMMFEVDRCPGAEYKVNPPLRDIDCRDRLFRRFLSGDIDMFGSDHAPHTAEEKAQEFDAAPGGIPGVETTMPMVMDMVRRDVIPMAQAVRMGAENPGRLFSVPKGRIAVGYDADLLIFDMRNSSVIDVRSLHSRCGHSPYGGFGAVFPETVMVRGEVQVEDGEFCGEPLGRDVCG